MESFSLFKDLPYAELKKIYEGIRVAEKEGLRPTCLNPYIKMAAEQLQFDSSYEAWGFTQRLFYEEITNRFFSEHESAAIPMFRGISVETGEEVEGNALELDDGEIRIATSCLTDSQDPDLITVVARRVKEDSIHKIDF